MKKLTCKSGIFALIPFFVFAVLYLSLSLFTGDFYSIPMTVAFLAASFSALLMSGIRNFDHNMNVYASGMGNSNIMLMCMMSSSGIWIISGVIGGGVGFLAMDHSS